MQQCLNFCTMVGLRTCFFGGKKASDISLLFDQLLLSQKVILNDISAKLVNQRQEQLISIVVGHLQVFVELNYPLSNNLFQCLWCPFTIVFHILFVLLTLLEVEPQEVPCHPVPFLNLMCAQCFDEMC